LDYATKRAERVRQILGSAYILGGTHEHLNDIYDREAKELEPWHDSPGEISKDDWRDFLGKREYVPRTLDEAWVDVWQIPTSICRLLRRSARGDAVRLEGTVERILIRRRGAVDQQFGLWAYVYPAICARMILILTVGHPLIHLGYAYELNSRTVATEALALGACFHNGLHKYLDDPSYTKPSPIEAASLLDMLKKVKADGRFDGLYDHRSGDVSKIFERAEAAFLEYWNAWDLSRPKEQFEESQKLAAALLMATPGAQDAHYDFFFVHLLTTSHAVRILLPVIPAKHHISLVRQWWLFTLAVYIAQTRPAIDLARIENYDLKGRDWKYVVHAALTSRHSLDAHFVKGEIIRAKSPPALTIASTPVDESSIGDMGR
jgi:hypothetical protein